jgi:glucokinase
VYDGENGSLAGTARTEAPSFQRHPGVSWHELRSKLLEEMSALRAVLDPQGLLGSAAVAFPGPVDGEGRVLAAPPLWGSIGDYPYALGRDLGAAWGGAAVRVMNDVTAAGFRYMRGQGDDFCLVTISTGIGNKVFVGGRPLLGSSGRGGEIGHLQVDASPSAAPCDCGGRGHLAALASGRGMQRRARTRAEAAGGGFRGSSLAAKRSAAALTVEDLAEAYRAGDAWAAGLVQDGVEALGSVLAAIHLAVGVDRVILVGGVSFGLGRRFCEDVAAAIRSRCWRGAEGGDPSAVRVVLGEDDGRCALLGAGRAVHLGLLT